LARCGENAICKILRCHDRIHCELPHRRKISSCHTAIFARTWLVGAGDEFWTEGAHGLHEHSISDSCQCSAGFSSQALPSMRQPCSSIPTERRSDGKHLPFRTGQNGGSL